MSGQSDRHPRPSLEEASPQRVQLVDSTGGLDEFAPEPERSLLRSEPPGAPSPRPKVILGGTGTDVTRVQPSRFDWTRHASRVALVSAVVVAAVAGTVVLQSPVTPPSAVDPTEPVTDSAPQLTMADPPPVSPSVVSTAPSEPPSLEAPIPSEVIPPPRGNLRGTPSTRARDTDSRSIPRVIAPSASLAVSATTPVPPRVATAAPVGALGTPAESTAAVAGSSLLSIPPVAAATLAPDGATSTASPPAPGLSPVVAGPRAAASPPAETFRSASTDVPVDAVARPTGRELDARAIENVLGRYRNAFNRLDAGAAVAVWPKVNEKTLARAFDSLDDQDVSFDSCTIEVGGVHAEAACSGTARYVPKVGSRTTRAEPRQWRFILRRASDGWLIDHVDAR